MKMIRQPFVLAVSLAAVLALGACGKTNDSGNTTPASPSSSSPPDASFAGAPPVVPTTPPATADNAAVTLDSVELGSGVDAGNKVIAASASFAPSDSIYAAVTTQGTGDVTLEAKWSYQDGQVVHEDSKALHANGPQTTAFMISHPGGFLTGQYKVDVSINGIAVASKDFSVK